MMLIKTQGRQRRLGAPFKPGFGLSGIPQRFYGNLASG